MSRQCCPKCEDHPILNEGLHCIFCGGYYVWKEQLNETQDKKNENN